MTSSSMPKLCINADTFLFACIEAYDARRLPNGGFNSHTRFEPFLFGTWKEPQERTVGALESELTQIVRHHWNTAPQFRRGEDVDMETLSYFSQAVVTLMADVETLFKAYTGLDFPSLPAEGLTATSGGHGTLATVLERYAEHLRTQNDETPAFSPWTADGDVEAEKLAYTIEVWSLVDNSIREILGDYSSVIQIFSRWKYAAKVEAEAIDWRVRPPVGEAFIRWLKIQDPDFFRRQREARMNRGRRDDGDGPRGEGRPPRGDRGDRDDRRPREGGPREAGPREAGPREGGPRRSDRGEGAHQARHVRDEGANHEGEIREERHHRAPREEKPHHGEAHPRDEHAREAKPARDEGHRREGGPREAGPREAGPREAGPRHPREERGPREAGPREAGPRRHRDDRGPRGEGRFEDRPRRHRGDRDDRGPQPSSEEQLEAALADASTAIAALRKDASLNEVPLAPVNSFLRRQQHTLIIEAGFETESRGEGRERCVFVKRKA